MGKYEFEPKTYYYDPETASFKEVPDLGQKYGFWLNIYFVMGVTIFVLGGIYFVLQTVSIKLTDSQNMALMISLGGLSLGIISKMLSEIIEKRMEMKRESVAQSKGKNRDIWTFLTSWVNLEESITEYFDQEDSPNIKKKIHILKEEGVISEDDAEEVLSALKIRNMIVHDGYNITPREAQGYSDEISEVAAKIDDSLKRRQP